MAITPIDNSPYTSGLYNYLVERATIALVNRDIEPDDIIPSWIEVEIAWSFNWITQFIGLNLSLKEKLAFDVKESALLCILTSKEISCRAAADRIKRHVRP